MSKRRGPEEGYQFGRKKQYRRHLWGAIAEHCRVPLEKAQVALMPSLEGAEIDEALKRGVRQENLHIIDMNPAIVATLKRRYPRVNSYGVIFWKAMERIKEKGITLDVVNADLCGPVTTAPWFMSRDAIVDVIGDGSVVAMTALRGRERGALVLEIWDWPEMMEDLSPVPLCRGDFDFGALWQDVAVGGARLSKGDMGRLRWMIPSTLLEWAVVRPLRCGVYKSTAGSQTMLWGLYGLTDQYEIAVQFENKWLTIASGPGASNDNAWKLRTSQLLLAASCDEFEALKCGRLGMGGVQRLVQWRGDERASTGTEPLTA